MVVVERLLCFGSYFDIYYLSSDEFVVGVKALDQSTMLIGIGTIRLSSSIYRAVQWAI